jgi:hypothetical protein
MTGFFVFNGNEQTIPQIPPQVFTVGEFLFTRTSIDFRLWAKTMSEFICCY